LKSNQKFIFLELFMSKNLLPVSPCPQNSTTKVTLAYVSFCLPKEKDWNTIKSPLLTS
jgi:hypothetical protein